MKYLDLMLLIRNNEIALKPPTPPTPQLAIQDIHMICFVCLVEC